MEVRNYNWVDTFESIESSSVVVEHLGRVYPIPRLLIRIWQEFSNGLPQGTQTPVVFENVSFHRSTIIQPNQKVAFNLCLSLDGVWNVKESEHLILSGKIREQCLAETHLFDFEEINSEECREGNHVALDQQHFYGKLETRKLAFYGACKGIRSGNMNGSFEVEWLEDWPSFLISLISIFYFMNESAEHQKPTGIQEIMINPGMLKSRLNLNAEAGIKYISAVHSKEMNTVKCPGVVIRGFETTSVVFPQPLDGTSTNQAPAQELSG